MRRAKWEFDETLVPTGWALSGALLLVAAALAAELARRHMIGLESICGDAVPHCGWCFAAVGFAIAGVAAFGMATKRPAAARA